jgi:Cu/Ag efflux protein CusF
MKSRFSVAVLLTAFMALGVFSACKKSEAPAATAPAPEVKTYSSTGVVQGFQSDGKVVVLKHEKIEGLMEGMTMGFELKDPALAKGIQKGDKVSFSLEVSADNMLLSAIKKQ